MNEHFRQQRVKVENKIFEENLFILTETNATNIIDKYFIKEVVKTYSKVLIKMSLISMRMDIVRRKRRSFVSV